MGNSHLLRLTNFTGHDNEFGQRIFFKNQAWSAIFGCCFEENVYISNVAVELLNNLMLNNAVREKIVETKGMQTQIKQLFSVTNGYISEGVKSYTEKAGQVEIPFDCHLIKIKALLGIICILDDVDDLFNELVAQIKLSSISSLLVTVKDSEFNQQIISRLDYMAKALLSKGVDIDPQETVTVAALDKHLSKDQLKALSMSMAE